MINILKINHPTLLASRIQIKMLNTYIHEYYLKLNANQIIRRQKKPLKHKLLKQLRTIRDILTTLIKILLSS